MTEAIAEKIRNSTRILSPGALVVVQLALGVPTVKAADCQFVLGFKELHDAIPDIVGNCLDNESHNPINGDGIQHTINGEEVWRKASNDVAFTNGGTTFLRDPNGNIVSRPATERFPFEPDYWAAKTQILNFPPEFETRERSSLFLLAQTFPEYLTDDYFDPKFRAAFEQKYPGWFDRLMPYVTQTRTRDFFNYSTGISLVTQGCDGTATACGNIPNNKKGNVFVYPEAISNALWVNDQSNSGYAMINFKEGFNVFIGLTMINQFNLTQADVPLINNVREDLSFDAALQWGRVNYPSNSPYYTQTINFFAGNTLGQ